MRTRRLSVILVADAVGYSRLMAEDEESTVAALNEARGVFRRSIESAQGRIIDTAGDSILADFASPAEAVRVATAIQAELDSRNAGRPQNRRLDFRIGLNLGDVVEDSNALYGDVVNVAARLQELAESGGICVAGTVFDQVDGKVPERFRSIGEQWINGSNRPVRAYQIVRPGPARRARAILTLAAVSCLVAAGIVLWPRLSARDDPARQPVPHTAYVMPSGPVIAVLPFDNLDGRRDRDYLADGLTEDIITELARFQEFYVLSRNSTSRYRKEPVDAVSVGRTLNANYVIEGSVRRSGNRLRISAQLTDAANGAQLWAEKYDRDVHDVFLIQDDIASRIAAAVSGGSSTAIPKAIGDASFRKRPSDLQAYEHVLRAGIFFHTWSKENYVLAKAHLEKAIELAPEYARARHQYAYALLIGWISYFEESPAPPKSIIANAVKSVELDPTDYRAHRTAAFGHFFDKNLQLFDRHATHAIQLAPNDAEVLAEMGALYTFSGNWERGPALVIKAQNLNREAAGGWYHAALHYDYFRKGQYREALEIVVAHPEQYILHTQWKYVAAYAELGEIGKAREHFEKCRKIDPTWSADRMREELRLWNFQEEFIDTYLASFAKAGYRERNGL